MGHKFYDKVEVYGEPTYTNNSKDVIRAGDLITELTKNPNFTLGTNGIEYNINDTDPESVTDSWVVTSAGGKKLVHCKILKIDHPANKNYGTVKAYGDLQVIKDNGSTISITDMESRLDGLGFKQGYIYANSAGYAVLVGYVAKIGRMVYGKISFEGKIAAIDGFYNDLKVTPAYARNGDIPWSDVANNFEFYPLREFSMASAVVAQGTQSDYILITKFSSVQSGNETFLKLSYNAQKPGNYTIGGCLTGIFSYPLEGFPISVRAWTTQEIQGQKAYRMVAITHGTPYYNGGTGGTESNPNGAPLFHTLIDEQGNIYKVYNTPVDENNTSFPSIHGGNTTYLVSPTDGSSPFVNNSLFYKKMYVNS